MRQNSSSTLSKAIIGGVAAIVLIGLFLGAVWFMSPSAMGSVKKDRYQAVFLSNGQVYFGKIKSITGSTYTLDSIYYLQQNVQNQSKDSKDTTPQQNQLSLTKLGKELHGPEDTMYVERQQVLFWENLKDDSQVVTKIKEAQKQQ